MIKNKEVNKENLKKELTNYLVTKSKLEERVFTTRDVMRLLGVSQMQILYWIKKGLTLTGTYSPAKRGETNRFAPLDLFGFGVMQEMRKTLIQVELCNKLFTILRDYVTDSYTFLLDLSQGNPIILVVNRDSIKAGRLLFYLGSAKNFDILTSVKQISIIIPVNVIYRRVISKLDKGSLRAKFVKDYNCLEERVVYIIGGREIEIKTPASVFATVGISFPLDSVDHVTETKKLKK